MTLAPAGLHPRAQAPARGRRREPRGRGRAPPLKGKRDVAYALRFHLHPQARPTLAADGLSLDIRLPNRSLWRFEAGGEPIALEESVMFASTEGMAPHRADRGAGRDGEPPLDPLVVPPDGGVGVGASAMLAERPVPGASPARCRPTSAASSAPHLRFGQGGPDPLRDGARRARRRAALDRRHPRRAGGGGAEGQGRLGAHRLPRDHGRPRQDAASQGAWRACSASA